MSMFTSPYRLGDGNISPDVDLSRLLDQRWKKARRYIFIDRGLPWQKSSMSS